MFSKLFKINKFATLFTFSSFGKWGSSFNYMGAFPSFILRHDMKQYSDLKKQGLIMLRKAGFATETASFLAPRPTGPRFGSLNDTFKYWKGLIEPSLGDIVDVVTGLVNGEVSHEDFTFNQDVFGAIKEEIVRRMEYITCDSIAIICKFFILFGAEQDVWDRIEQSLLYHIEDMPVNEIVQIIILFRKYGYDSESE